jgi:probable rRNA maturation factor
VSEVAVSGRRLPVSRSLVQRVVQTVLRRERRAALISVTFLGRDSMRRLNAQHKGHDRPTDVLTFALSEPAGRIMGDVYICPWVARQEARARGIPFREELIRLIVHGTLHALGRDHPEGPERTQSAMWRRQERYVEALA